MSSNGGKTSPEEFERTIRALGRKSRLWEIVTFVLVILVSPASLVFGLPFGISTGTWLNEWVHWVFLFVLLVMAIALLGFNEASTYWLRAERLKKQLR